LCIYIAVFPAASDGATAERQIQNRIFSQFVTTLRKDSVANYASIWTPSVRVGGWVGFNVSINTLSVNSETSLSSQSLTLVLTDNLTRTNMR